MAFINTVPANESQATARDMYARQQKALGYVPGYAKIFSLRPDLMGLWANLQRGIRNTIAAREYELATLAAARALRSTNCSLAHGTFLLEYFSQHDVSLILAGKGVVSGVISEKDAALMNFADYVARDASATTQTDIDELRELGFADEEIFDIAATAAARSFFTKLLDSLGSDADHPYLQLENTVKDQLLVGRAISLTAKERVD
jgi:alkylhydroperoxidase family enzyme